MVKPHVAPDWLSSMTTGSSFEDYLVGFLQLPKTTHKTMYNVPSYGNKEHLHSLNPCSTGQPKLGLSLSLSLSNIEPVYGPPNVNEPVAHMIVEKTKNVKYCLRNEKLQLSVSLPTNSSTIKYWFCSMTP